MASFWCNLGFHRGPWNPTPGNPCEERRRCPRCTTVETRPVHAYELPADGRVIYVSDRDCQVRGQCTRCGHIGGALGVIHHWGPFSTVRPNSDQTVVRRYCQHCGGHDERVSEPLTFDG